MNNNNIAGVRRASALIRLWHSTDGPGTPLVCRWVETMMPRHAVLIMDVRYGDYTLK